MRIIDWFNKKVKLYKIYNIYKDCLYLLNFVLKKSVFWILLNKNFLLNKHILLCLNILFIRRLRGEPLSYIIGIHYFYNLSLKIFFDIFIPRFETEVMVSLIVSIIKKHKILDILELGIGSGAISLVLAKKFPNIKVTGIDINFLAVYLSNLNAKRLRLKNTSFFYSNWFSHVNFKNSLYNIIISNPPYIKKNSCFLFKGDLRYESYFSLVSYNNGLKDILYIIKYSTFFLKKNGYLIIEHDHLHVKLIYYYFIINFYKDVKSYKDYNNLYRFTIGRFLG